MTDYVEAARRAAEDAAFGREKGRIAIRRQTEKFLIARGRGGPFDDLVLSDIETLEPERVAILRGDKEFAAREKFLLAEREAAIAAAREFGEDAALNAAANAPPHVLLADRQEGELLAFQSQNGIIEIDNAAPALRATWAAMKKKHEAELAALSHGNKKK